METVSRFNGLNFKKTAVVSGKKVTASSRPELILNPTKDSFGLNPKASQLMSAAPGERVVMLDLGAKAKDINSRYFICKSYNKGAVEMGAKTASTSDAAGIGAKLNFSYAGIWASMLLMAKTESKETEVSTDDLKLNDLVKATANGKSVSSKLRLRFKLEPIGSQVVDDFDGNDISADVFALVDVASDEITEKEEAEE